MDTAKYIQSFRVQNLQPDTVYATQVRCKNDGGGQYWSEWSANATKRTPEDSEFYDCQFRLLSAWFKKWHLDYLNLDYLIVIP